ncbi:glycoside hydrolase family 127 protein [Dellaglioa sp. BT-FLS60]
MKKIEITSSFWRRYRELIVKEVLPYQWAVMNDEADIDIAHEPGGNEADSKNSHAIANLKIAAGQETGHHFGYPFQDTDVYKWLEAAAYSFNYHPDANLREITDNLIDLIAEAQDEDGYLSTFFQIDAPERKFKRLKQSHELYTMGHYIEAGIAYYQATGNKKALDIAIKMADCIDNHFGLSAGKIHGGDGHPEIELALMRLYDETQESKYLALTQFFINQRGQDPEFFDDQIKLDGLDNDLIDGMKSFPDAYYQAGEPIIDQETAEGHAVRVVYLCTGMAHLARETGDKELLAACHRFWNDIVQKRMYITGGIGSTNIGEAFTYDYDLPNDTMYGETCASVGMAFFAKQMLGIEAKGEYGDVLEKELFNGTLSGMSLDGKHFFYVNPLEADPVISKNNPSRNHVLTQRADWFGCACCPSNVARLIASVDTYIYHETDNVILSDQFIANKAEFDNGITIEQTNNFPWDGDIQYHLANPNSQTFKFGIRIPGWSQANYQVTVNGSPIKSDLQDGFIYFTIDGTELDIQLTLDMSAKFMQANELVRYDFGKVSVQRGPIVYCAEEVDNEAPLWKYRVAVESPLESSFQETLLNGVVQVKAKAKRSEIKTDQALYAEYQKPNDIETSLTLIPYYAWANRDDGQMSVWLNH